MTDLNSTPLISNSEEPTEEPITIVVKRIRKPIINERNTDCDKICGCILPIILLLLISGIILFYYQLDRSHKTN